MIVPIILSGGAGTRLWPLSREEYPKQLLPLNSDLTMLQETAARLNGMEDVAAPMVVCNESHRFLVAEQMRVYGSDGGDIILEPCGRNTAPAVAIAALQAVSDGSDPVLLVLPADHLIQQVDVFQQAVAYGVHLAEQGKLVTFGIVADKPETGYGYIKANTDCPLSAVGDLANNDSCAFMVDSFVEKPDLDTAQSYLDSGDYFWNSGMFMFKASKYLSELSTFNPEMHSACQIAHGSLQHDLDFLRLDAEQFAACPSDSIDYAVMEKTHDAVVIPLAAGWNDIGAWSALWEVGEQSSAGNVVHGDVLTADANNCYLHAESRLLAGVGIDNLVVVETVDAVLVADKSRVQEVKEIVAQLKLQQRNEARLHRRANRPWGSYERVDAGERFQVKRITVNPGACLSLQMHHHRAEHWIVVHGTAKIVRGEETFLLSENQSTYIPLGTTHRLENPGTIPLEMIEIQSGSYLGEDDIVRLEDTYGRS
ncbi:MAG: mannose-1-phosphate guanylyltransferase/mannose-6-phosphate isomerase [Desulfobacteraceae bacterium 4572_35.1]|nr:MAG: mannose-1-phosphate guanylyltransferase/mannose-6-phosphate isomerase [Desulfobacteraceae bacterium 4572_35.1]